MCGLTSPASEIVAGASQWRPGLMRRPSRSKEVRDVTELCPDHGSGCREYRTFPPFTGLKERSSGVVKKKKKVERLFAGARCTSHSRIHSWRHLTACGWSWSDLWRMLSTLFASVPRQGFSRGGSLHRENHCKKRGDELRNFGSSVKRGITRFGPMKMALLHGCYC